MSTPGSSANKSMRNWSKEETKVLLKALKERDMIKKMEGRDYKHAQLREILKEDLHRHGYQRTSEQIKTRLKTLRDKYYAMRHELNRSSGGGNVKWEYYVDMLNLYGRRPSANRKGVDSEKLASDKSRELVTIPIKAASDQGPVIKQIEMHEIADPNSSAEDLSEVAVKSPVIDDRSVEQEDKLEYTGENQIPFRLVRSRQEIFAMRSLFSTALDRIQENIDNLSNNLTESAVGFVENSTAEKSADATETEKEIQKEKKDKTEDECEIQEIADTEEESEENKRKKRRQSFEEKAEEILQYFDAAEEEIQKEKEVEIENECENQEIAEAEKESEEHKRKKCLQSFEEKAKEIIQSLDAKCAETIKSLQECHKKVLAQGISELDQAMQKNALLMFQACAMGQNFAQNSSQCNFTQDPQPHCSTSQNPFPLYYTSQNQLLQPSSHENTHQFNFSQEAGTPIGVPLSFSYTPNPVWFPEQNLAAYCAPPSVSNLQSFNYLGQSMPDGFSVPIIASVPNSFFSPCEGSNTTASNVVNVSTQVEEQSVESLQENPVENLQENPTEESTDFPQCTVDASVRQENHEENLQENSPEESTGTFYKC